MQQQTNLESIDKTLTRNKFTIELELLKIFLDVYYIILYC